MEPVTACRTVRTIRARWRALTRSAWRRMPKSTSAAAAMCSNALVSFGRHGPPQPGPGARKSGPIRASMPIVRVTSPMSAPYRSHSSARTLTYDNFTARKALLAYFVSSALAVSVRTTGAPVGA
ncbi:hypothetical protein GCM10029964_051890 [Kibdelosporangium lantanae]